ncbi:MAG TPA: hypothetical protein VN624_14310, partial [Rhodanobacter sp.]|nr:hypothetical protein [Rhodanobacter sp.]
MRNAFAPRAKSGRSPSATELLSLCVAKEKVTKREGHPASALSGHPARKVRVRATGFFDSTSCAGEKLAGIPAGHPAGFPTPARRYRGVLGKAAGHRGPHSVMKRKSKSQSQSQSRASVRRSSALDLAVLKSAGQDGSLLYRGPCAAVRRGRQAAQRASAGMPMPFRQHMDVLSKSPAPAHGLAGQARAWMPELRQRRSSCPMPGKR